MAAVLQQLKQRTRAQPLVLGVEHEAENPAGADRQPPQSPLPVLLQGHHLGPGSELAAQGLIQLLTQQGWLCGGSGSHRGGGRQRWI